MNRFKGYLNEVGGKPSNIRELSCLRFKGYLNEVGGKHKSNFSFQPICKGI